MTILERVIPLLTALKDKDPLIRWIAIRALNKIAIRELRKKAKTGKIGPLIDTLKDEDLYLRKQAAKILDKLGWKPSNNSELAIYLIAKRKWKKLPAVGPDAVEPLIDLLGDRKQLIQNAVIETLGEIGDPEAIGPLIRGLTNENFLDHKKVIKALRKIKNAGPTVQAFTKVLKSKDHYVRQSAAEVLEKIGWEPSNNDELTLYLIARKEWEKIPAAGEAAVKPLIDILTDEDSSVREKAVEVLGKMNDPRSVEPIIDILEDDDPYVREKAVEVLGEIGDPRALDSLIDALKEGGYGIREAAAVALGRTANIKAVKPLLTALEDEDIFFRTKVAEALDKLGTGTGEFLLTVLKDKDPVVWANVSTLLEKIGDTRAVESLITHLKDEYQIVREEAARALGKFRDPRAVEPLITAGVDWDSKARKIVVEALGEIGDPSALDFLVTALKDKNSDVREEAAKALGKVGDSSAVKPLLKATLRGFSRKKWKEAAKDALEKISPRLITDEVNFICEKCFYRYKLQTAAYLNIYTFKSASITYWTCPKCQSDLYYLVGIEKIVLLIDHNFEEVSLQDGENLIVNWFKIDEPFDYDEIRIIDADDYDVEKLVMTLRNDMDNQRIERMPDIPLYLSSGLTLSQAKMNMLKDNFNVITSPTVLERH